MKRREFITLLGGAAAAWPLAARAQERVRRVGVLMYATSGETESQARVTALVQSLQEAGWVVGRNMQMDVRWNGGDFARLRSQAAELVAAGADVIVAGIGPTMQAAQQVTRTIPIVFAQAVDPVGIGVIKSMARPGGNITGFTQFEYVLSAKWLELLREVAPGTVRVGVVRDPIGGAAVGIGQWAVIGAAASPLGVELTSIEVSVAGNVENALMEIAGGTNQGLIVAVGTAVTIHRDAIIATAAQAARRLSLSVLRRSGRSDVLWPERDRRLPPHRQLRRPHPERREACEPAGASADQVRACDQPQDREGAGPHRAPNAARACRRGDRINRDVAYWRFASFRCSATKWSLLGNSGSATTGSLGLKWRE